MAVAIRGREKCNDVRRKWQKEAYTELRRNEARR
jgi:hypothetical protein